MWLYLHLARNQSPICHRKKPPIKLGWEHARACGQLSDRPRQTHGLPPPCRELEGLLYLQTTEVTQVHILNLKWEKPTEVNRFLQNKLPSFLPNLHHCPCYLLQSFRPSCQAACTPRQLSQPREPRQPQGQSSLRAGSSDRESLFLFPWLPVWTWELRGIQVYSGVPVERSFWCGSSS